ncbi:hypothetical protein N7470_005094 [Penicillium chermesinum]|nr:hypothetical protein N7470_005094 [Penicillium chermesinum]
MSHPDTCDCSRCDPSPEFFQQPSATSINKLVGEAKFKVAFHLRESQEQGACHSLVFDNENTLFRDEDQELNLVHSLEDEVRFILIDTIRRFECKKEYFNYLEVEVAFKEFERHCRLQRPLPVRLSLFLIAAVGDFTSSIETRGKQEIRDRYLSKHVTEDDIREYVKIGYDHFGFFCAGLSWLNSVVRVSWDHDLRLTRACSEGIIHPTGDTEEEKPEKLNIAPMVPTNANACSRVSPEKVDLAGLKKPRGIRKLGKMRYVTGTPSSYRGWMYGTFDPLPDCAIREIIAQGSVAAYRCHPSIFARSEDNTFQVEPAYWPVALATDARGHRYLPDHLLDTILPSWRALMNLDLKAISIRGSKQAEEWMRENSGRLIEWVEKEKAKVKSCGIRDWPPPYASPVDGMGSPYSQSEKMEAETAALDEKFKAAMKLPEIPAHLEGSRALVDTCISDSPIVEQYADDIDADIEQTEQMIPEAYDSALVASEEVDTSSKADPNELCGTSEKIWSSSEYASDDGIDGIME